MTRLNSLSSLATLSFFTSSGGEQYPNGWVEVTTDNDYRDVDVSYTTSSIGQIVTVGGSAASPSATGRIINRHSSNGEIYWAYNYPANTYIFMNGCSFEKYTGVPTSAQNVYVSMSHASSSSAVNGRTTILRITPTGTLAFQRTVRTTVTNQAIFPNNMSSDNTGVVFTSSDNIVRFNTSGTTAFQRSYTEPSGHSLGIVRGVDSYNGKTWFAADSFLSSNGFSQIFSLSTTGTELWKRQIRPTTLNKLLIIENIAVDNNENVYLAGRHNVLPTGFVTGVIIKLDSSGNLLWSRDVSNSSSTSSFSISFEDIEYSNVDDTITLTTTFFVNQSNTMILKMTSSGDMVFARTVNTTQASNFSDRISLDKYSFMYGVRGSNVLYKLKNNGVITGSGSYSSFTYSNIESLIQIVDSASNITITTSTATTAASSLTIETPAISLSSVTPSQTITKVE